MYKDTVYSAFNLLMHYPPPSGAGQHPQPQPPLVSGPSSPARLVAAASLTSTIRPVSLPMASPNSLLSMNISAAHTPHLHRLTSTRSKCTGLCRLRTSPASTL
ncbi:transcription factor 7 [Rhinolophus ferrumequinum]|uniref:Transcription factor 7 n=1 Tax=Rhinolophus ferrumequinum TaxID=59479 RepID=A0A7J7RZN8_RHIFE|nr:transcription factor 7 [Rhinolophus ferrumequinum]